MVEMNLGEKETAIESSSDVPDLSDGRPTRPSYMVPRPPNQSVVGTTLREHVLFGMRANKGATGEFTSLLNHISLAARIIHSKVRSAGLHGLFGYTGETNVQGEKVQKLDNFANDVLLTVLRRSGHCGVIASEELDEAVFSDHQGKYVICFDPLDGSSNIDTNVSIGTVFGIWRRKNRQLKPNVSDLLQIGRDMIGAGYILFGPSTLFVLSTGSGVDAFTLDPEVGEFFLSAPHILVPKKGNIYSINEGNFPFWNSKIQSWARHMKGDYAGYQQDEPSYSCRYVGSMVVDAHRTLLKGGIFVYPEDSRYPRGKLRLLYEAAPMAYLFEQAGGAAIDGKKSVLDILPESVHARVPLAMGSKEDVALYKRFVDEGESSCAST